jgi:sec-independent protein translocase protein TatB
MLGMLALVIFGPERLPTIARQAGKAVRQFKAMAASATSELKEGLGDDLGDLKDLRNMDPRRWLMDDEPAHQPTPARAAPVLPTGARPPYDSEAT